MVNKLPKTRVYASEQCVYSTQLSSIFATNVSYYYYLLKQNCQ